MVMKDQWEESWQRTSASVILTYPASGDGTKDKKKKSANLKHVNNMCLTQTAKSNSLLTLPQLFPPSLIY